MSAVFLLAISSLPHARGGTPIPTAGSVPLSGDVERVHQVATERLAAISDTVVARVVADFWDPESWDPTDETIDHLVRGASGPRERAQVALADFLDRVFFNPSDDQAPRFWESECDVRTIGQVPYVMWGDKSWGDIPEGDWEIIAAVGSLGLFDEPIPSQGERDCAHDDTDLRLTEQGYARSWGTHIDRAAGVLTAVSGGSNDWSDDGDGDQHLECRLCGTVLPVPEGFTINWQ